MGQVSSSSRALASPSSSAAKGPVRNVERDTPRGISAHSRRVGLNQDLFTNCEDLAGIMDALRWKSPPMPLAYNRNLAAEQGAGGV